MPRPSKAAVVGSGMTVTLMMLSGATVLKLAPVTKPSNVDMNVLITLPAPTVMVTVPMV